MATKKSDVPGESGIEIGRFVCEHCGAKYQTHSGLKYHLERCEYKPDSETEKEPGADTSGGVDLYDSAEQDTSDADDDIYQCPDCGYSAKRAFMRCPGCGADLEW